MSVQAVVVAVSILEAVADSGPIGVSQISRITGAPKATAQRMLSTWHTLGWVQKDTNTPVTWSLTGKILEIGSRFHPISELKQTAHREMERLSAQLGGETIHLTIQTGTRVTLVDRVEGTKSIRTHYPIGGSTPAYATATGHAHLSTMSNADIVHRFKAEPMTAVTPLTIIDVDELLSALAEGRERGYFQVEGTNHSETSAIAAPIIDDTGRSVGAISISLPTSRVTDPLASHYGQAVASTATTITELLANQRHPHA